MAQIAGWLVDHWWVLPLILGVAVALAIIVAACIVVPVQARRRGHGFWSWFLLQFAALNPVYPLILVAMLPNKARLRLREQFARELDELLAKAGTAPPAPARSGEITAGTSVGDMPTAAAQRERSLGDEETRA